VWSDIISYQLTSKPKEDNQQDKSHFANAEAQMPEWQTPTEGSEYIDITLNAIINDYDYP
jgi:hypothetical protein